MKQLSGEKYNVAWFKLAEFVARGEKERALALYRLLTHSFDNVAFAAQLEGDLLLSFNDEEALVKYVNAANLFLAQEKVMQAAAIYEHLLTLRPDSLQYAFELYGLYAMMQHTKRMVELVEKIAPCVVKMQLFEKISELIKIGKPIYTSHQLIEVYKIIIINAAKIQEYSDFYDHYLKQVLDLLLHQTGMGLQLFLDTLRELDSSYYQKSQAFLDNIGQAGE
jgi:hemerythrin superfamily protein